METSYMLPCLCRTVLAHVLRQGKHQRLAIVKDINLLTLLLSKLENHNQSHRDNHRTHSHKYNSEKPYLTER